MYICILENTLLPQELLEKSDTTFMSVQYVWTTILALSKLKQNLSTCTSKVHYFTCYSSFVQANRQNTVLEVRVLCAVSICWRTLRCTEQGKSSLGVSAPVVPVFKWKKEKGKGREMERQTKKWLVGRRGVKTESKREWMDEVCLSSLVVEMGWVFVPESS